MCASDVSINTFLWPPKGSFFEGRPLSKRTFDRVCVNWDKVQSWAESRRVDLSNPNALIPQSEQNLT